MAKGKHSTALFEVINRPARSAVTPPPVISRAPQNVPGAPAPVATPVPPTAAGPGDPAVLLDRDRHQISLRVSYTSALVTAFAVLVVVVLAYVVGRGFSHNSPEIANASTEEIKNGPAQPAVLDVSAPEHTTPTVTLPSQPKPSTAAPQPVVATGPLAPPTNVRRIVGQNYVIMQSYPDEATAKDAQATLLANGISCTIEKGPPGWASSDWFSVVGTVPFDHVTKNPQLDAYMKSVEGVKYGEKSKFKKFDPRAYRWK